MLDNLEPHRLYSVDLDCKDSIGRSYTYHLGFLTQPVNYQKYGVEILNINISDITDKSAKITWSTKRAVECILCCPIFCYDDEINPSHNHQVKLPNLKPDTEYWVQILVKGNEGVSDVFNFRTLKVMDKADLK